MRMRAWTGAIAVAVLVACGGPSVPPVGDSPDDSAAGGPVDGCRPPLGDDEDDPIDGEGGQHPAFEGEWVGRIAEQVQTEHTDVLGGLWLDNDAGELVVMVPGTEGREVFERLRQEAPEPERVVCMEATRPWDELERLQRTAFERLTAADVGPASGGTDTRRNRISIEVEGELDEARSALGDLADHEAIELSVPACAEVEPVPEGATALPGGASNCSSMQALFTGTLVGDPGSGCAWLEDPEGQPLTVVWPRGWSITDDGTILDHRGEPRASLGDEVESGGGHVPLAEGQRACGIGGEDGAWVVGSLEPASEG